jgi:hypothetical protein
MGKMTDNAIHNAHAGVLERYRIAQVFHELAASGGDRSAAASQLSVWQGVSAEDVLEFAAEFGREPLWRL